MMPDLLYEIGTEEIPAAYIQPALDQLCAALERELSEARLEHSVIGTAGTPRRLVLAVADVTERQPDTEEEILGPPAKVAFDADGNPAKAALGFARSQGVDVSEIRRKDTPRGTYCVLQKRTKGRPAAEILAEVLPKITVEISFPKSMLWPGSERPFARPVRWLLALLGDRVIPFSLFGLQSGRSTEGHPFLRPGRFDVPNADLEAYREQLRAHKVILDAHEREIMILRGIEKAESHVGVVASGTQEQLVDEVANLVQYPSVTLAHFDEGFLELPDAVIKAAMMEHQRYFPLEGPGGKLRPHFIVVSDRSLEHSDVIRQGNEAVLHARLADAQFFYQQDQKERLADRVAKLDGVQFLRGIGTYRDKSHRLEKLAATVSEVLDLDRDAAAHAARAALLCKADLVTAMVGEFPKLQGEVGRIYALRDGEPPPIADAIAEHYMPRSANDRLPETPAGRALSLAEKLDNLIACFALELIPTGSADPYALRRQAQAALRIIEDSGRHLNVVSIINKALELLPAPHCRAKESTPRLLEFLRDRLFQMALDRDAPDDLIKAVLAVGFDDMVDFWMRLDALRRLSQQDIWPALVEAVERTFNISKTAPAEGAVNTDLFSEPMERELWSLFIAHRDRIEQVEKERKYTEASEQYCEALARPLHEFFEKVFVNVEDEKIRNNRLTLLREINRLYSDRIADLSQIVTGVHTAPGRPEKK